MFLFHLTIDARNSIERWKLGNILAAHCNTNTDYLEIGIRITDVSLAIEFGLNPVLVAHEEDCVALVSIHGNTNFGDSNSREHDVNLDLETTHVSNVDHGENFPPLTPFDGVPSINGQGNEEKSVQRTM